MAEKLEYVVLAVGWISGTLCKRGDIVELTEKAARYENVVRNTPEALEAHSKAKAAAKAAAEKDAAEKAKPQIQPAKTAPSKMVKGSALNELERAESKHADASKVPAKSSKETSAKK